MRVRKGVKVRVAVRRRGGLGAHPARLARNSETRVTNSHTWSGFRGRVRVRARVRVRVRVGVGVEVGVGVGVGVRVRVGVEVRVRVQPGHRAALLAEPLQLERHVLVGVDPVLHELRK